MSDNNKIQRLHTHDVELGVADVLQAHVDRHVVSPKRVSQRKLDYERRRPRWLRECIAETTGVFFYVFPGIACVTAFIINKEDAAFGSFLAIGFAFAFGIAFAIITCAPTSGGHFNPAVTISLAIHQGFPWKKVPRYILSQIFGSFMAGLLMFGMYHQQIKAYTAALIAKGGQDVMNGGPASFLVSYPGADQYNLGYLFMIEFFVCFYLGVVIWAVLDPANPFVSPASAPFVIGLAYATMIWAYADITIGTNLARDLGCRLVALIFYGGEAFTYRNYSWIPILVNVPATVLATTFYELVMRDSLTKIGKGAAHHEDGEDGLTRHLTSTGMMPPKRDFYAAQEESVEPKRMD